MGTKHSCPTIEDNTIENNVSTQTEPMPTSFLLNCLLSQLYEYSNQTLHLYEIYEFLQKLIY